MCLQSSWLHMAYPYWYTSTCRCIFPFTTYPSNHQAPVWWHYIHSKIFLKKEEAELGRVSLRGRTTLSNVSQEAWKSPNGHGQFDILAFFQKKKSVLHWSVLWQVVSLICGGFSPGWKLELGSIIPVMDFRFRLRVNCFIFYFSLFYPIFCFCVPDFFFIS